MFILNPARKIIKSTPHPMSTHPEPSTQHIITVVKISLADENKKGENQKTEPLICPQFVITRGGEQGANPRGTTSMRQPPESRAPLHVKHLQEARQRPAPDHLREKKHTHVFPLPKRFPETLLRKAVSLHSTAIHKPLSHGSHYLCP